MGLGLTIPLAFSSDFVMGKPNVLTLSSIMGALTVLVGFLFVNVGNNNDDPTETTIDNNNNNLDNVGHNEEERTETTIDNNNNNSPMELQTVIAII